jgi:multiple sugar transport system substrate-binding protein
MPRRIVKTLPAVILLISTLLISASGSSGLVSAQDDQQARYDGVQLTVAGPAGQVECIEQWSSQWEEETGAQVTVNPVPFSDLDSKVLAAHGTGTFLADVYYIGSQTAGQLMANGHVLEVPAEFQDRLGLDQIPDIYNKYQLRWNDKLYGIPWDGDVLMLNYRKDLLGDATNQQEFKDQFGYDLAPPESWEQYANIAEFFTGKDWDNDGAPNFGLAELPMRRNHAWNGFLSRAASYAKHPDDPAFFFDPETMAPRINNPGFVKALEDWKTAMQWGPPDMLSYDWAANAQAFVGGRAALNIQWADIGPMSVDPETSVVAGNVGFGVLPGSNDVWNPQTGEWETPEQPNTAPFAGFGGWIYVVPNLTQQPDAAMDLATFLGSPEVRTAAVTTPGCGVNPNATNMLEPSIWVNAGFSEEDAQAYTQAIADSLNNPNVVFDLRIPGIPEYKDALEIAVTKALVGEATPQEALDQAATEWDAITDRLGREQQAQYYRESLGIASE